MTRRRTGSFLAGGLIAIVIAAACSPALADSTSSSSLIVTSSSSGTASSFVTISQSSSSSSSSTTSSGLRRMRTNRAALARARRLLDRVEALAGTLAATQAYPQAATAVCPVLTSVRATVVAQINVLIARFPQVAGRLIDVRDMAVAIIDRQRTALHCT